MILVVAYTLFLLLLLGSNTRSQNPTRTPGPNFSPTVSIVIPTYNEAEVIEQRLENILELEYPRDKLQVLVVDSASTDNTRDKVRQFTDKHRQDLHLSLLEQPARLGKADAINQALIHAKTEYFVLTDADVTTPRGALQQLLSNLSDKAIGGASGVEVPIGNRTVASSLEAGYKAIYTAIRMAEAETDTPFMCESEFSAYRREILRPLRPGCMCDDIELTVAVRSAGLKGRYDPRALFLEREAGTLRSKLRHKLRRGMANQHALLRASNVLFNSRYGRYGSIVFPFEFITHIVSPFLITSALALLLTILLFSPMSGVLATILSLLATLPPVSILYALTLRYKTGQLIGLRNRLDWIAGATAFFFFQVALLASLLQLMIRGPNVKWEKISQTRAEPIVSPLTSTPRIQEANRGL